MIFKKIDGSLPTLSSNSPLCSSGLNYIVVKANGDINRCFKDPSILGDMLEVNNIIYQEVKECGVKYACDASSDQMFCTQWNVKNKKNDFFYKNPVSINWKESEDPNTVNKKHIFAVIYPTERCNFKCPYCCNYYPDDNSNERPVVSERPLQDWFKFLELLYSKYQSNVQININGGEPFIRNDIVDIISRCLDYNFECSIVTNFSVFNQLEKLLNLNHKNKNKLSLSITLHPVNKNYDFSKSLKYILLFKESGYKLRITLLGWPENKKYHETYKLLFKEIDIPYWLKWCGGYSYTDEFTSYLIQENANKSTPEYLDEINWINKEVCKNKDEIYCTAGLDYFIINLDGEIFKCYGYYPDPKYRICTIKDPQFFINYKGSPKCECMNCNEYCEDYKVEVWKNNEKIWDALYWRERINSIDDINLNNLFLQIDLVRGCFNNCPYCFVGKQNHTSFINTDNILNFVDTIAPYKKGKKFINISGSGESLLHPDFEKIINNFTNNGFYCEIITSGLIFPEKLMKLENKQLIYLIISYHPCSKNWNFNKIEKLLSMVCNSNFYKVGSSLVRYKGNLKFRNDLLELNKKFNININEPTYRS